MYVSESLLSLSPSLLSMLCSKSESAGTPGVAPIYVYILDVQSRSAAQKHGVWLLPTVRFTVEWKAHPVNRSTQPLVRTFLRCLFTLAIKCG